MHTVIEEWKLLGRVSGRNAQQESIQGVNIFVVTHVCHDVLFAQLLPFKNGAWRFAKDSGVQILPVCIQGSQDALNHKWIASPASITLTYSEPFFVTDDSTYEASMTLVSEWMSSLLKSC
jgi:1-acyl-sn-glycerol-3-phosphate acyltransferase